MKKVQFSLLLVLLAILLMAVARSKSPKGLNIPARHEKPHHGPPALPRGKRTNYQNVY